MIRLLAKFSAGVSLEKRGFRKPGTVTTRYSPEYIILSFKYRVIQNEANPCIRYERVCSGSGKKLLVAHHSSPALPSFSPHPLFHCFGGTR
jgi:hypothetical protein